MRSIKNLQDLSGQRVLLRVDFNAPLAKDNKGKIIVADDSKIKASLPTIEFLLKQGAKIILLSHLGRPEGKFAKGLRMAPAVESLKRLLPKDKKKIGYMESWNFSAVRKVVDLMGKGEILFLENLRFHPGEDKNGVQFARSLSGLGRLYIDDAFGVSHRAEASTVAITKYLPSYAGFLMEKEVEALNRVVKNPRRPLLVMMGGAKVSTKIGMIKFLLSKADYILLGGGLANTFLKAKGYEVGKSLVEPEGVRLAKKFLANRKIVLPVDVVVAKNKNGKPIVRQIKAVKENEMILDIGPETIKLFAKLIRKANTLVWNGPMGFYENKTYSHGSIALGRLVAARSSGRAFGVVGGGETLDVLAATKMAKYIDHVSTGGGAMLEFLEGKKLPGIKALGF
ncbi:MAG: phosphoglycerate kinase [Patescibacteria group bacterium]|nr:phosphoglycerate kinase [Patescibacteria group bacterium]MDD5490344.1 phosphoglycerate kinase [Patescibacteria group bacterium]